MSIEVNGERKFVSYGVVSYRGLIIGFTNLFVVKYLDDFLKAKAGPTEKYEAPVTESMEYGWYKNGGRLVSSCGFLFFGDFLCFCDLSKKDFKCF